MPDIIQHLKDAYIANPASALNMLPELIRQYDEGLIKVLPCNVGDDLYWIDQTGVESFSVKCEKNGAYGIVIRANGIYIENRDGSVDKLNTTYAYVTREAAEKALEDTPCL